MANQNDYLSAIRQKYPYVQVDDALMNELGRRAKEGASTDQVLNDAAGYYQTQPSFLKPLSPNAYQGYTTQAQNEINPTYQGQIAANNADAANLEKRLKTGILQEQGNSGFLQTGGTNDELQYQLGRNELQRTLANANLGLQNAQAVTGRANDLYNNELGRNTANFQFGANAASGLGGLQNQQFGQQLQQAQGLQSLYSNPFILQSLPDSVKQAILHPLGVDYSY